MPGSTATAQEPGIVPITFRCNMLSPAFVDSPGAVSTPISCPGKNLPYTVPAGKNLCIATLYLMTKYPYNPLRYGNMDMHSMYLEIVGMSVAAHHPEVHFTPSYKYNTSKPLDLKISNGMSEEMYVYAFLGGWLVDEGIDCP